MKFNTSKIASGLVITLGLAVAAGVGYQIHKAAKERSEKRAVISLVSDTTVHLRGSLKNVPPEMIDKIEASIRTVKSWDNPELAEAAEGYLVGAREIMRRRVEANRLTQKAAASRSALAAHMQRAGSRGSAWIHTASTLKRQVERDHFDLDVQLKALAELLELLPEANKRLAPHVQASLLLEENVRRHVREEVLAEQKRAGLELDRVRQIVPR